MTSSSSTKKPGINPNPKIASPPMEIPVSMVTAGQTCKESLPNLYPVALSLALSTMWISPPPLKGSSVDRHTDMAVMQSNVFKTCLAGNLVKVTANKGVVTLTGVVMDQATKTDSRDTVRELPDLPPVGNPLVVIS